MSLVRKSLLGTLFSLLAASWMAGAFLVADDAAPSGVNDSSPTPSSVFSQQQDGRHFVTQSTDPSYVFQPKVKRRENGKKAVYKLNGKTMAPDSDAQQFYIKADDTITVAESIF